MNVNNVNINPNTPAIEILRSLYRASPTIPYDPDWAMNNSKIVGATELRLNGGEMYSFLTPDERMGIVIGVKDSCLVIHESHTSEVVACAPVGYELIYNNSDRLMYDDKGLPRHRANIWFDFIKDTDALGNITNISFTAMIERVKTMLAHI